MASVIVIESSDSEDDVIFVPACASTPSKKTRSVLDLRPPEDNQSAIKRQAIHALVLRTNADILALTPCERIESPLTSTQAAELFQCMMNESKHWQTTKFHLFGRDVQSPHTTSFYADSGSVELLSAAEYKYNGQPVMMREFPEALKHAARLVEDEVNSRLKVRGKRAGEWTGRWRANMCAANLYDGAKQSVGMHSDALTYLGPWPTIASLSLGVTRTFRLKNQSDSDQARPFDIPLRHNDLLIMHAGTQETTKHAVMPARVIDTYKGSPARINLTFRFYRPDFQPQSVPMCKCGLQAVLRPDLKGKMNVAESVDLAHFWMCNVGL